MWTGNPIAAQWNEEAVAANAQRLMQWVIILQVANSSAGIEELAREVDYARRARDEAWQAITATWPGAAACKSSSEAEQLIARYRSTMATADAHAQLMKELEQTHQNHVHHRQTLEQQLAAQQTAFQQTVATLGLPEVWPTAEFPSRLERLKQCQALAQRVDKMRERQQDTDKRLSTFADSITGLAKRMGLEAVQGLPEDAASLWFDQFTHSEQADHRRMELNRLIESQRAAKEKRVEQVQQLEQAIGEMVNKLGATSSEQVQQWTDKATTVFQLRAREAELRAALESNAAGRPLDEFLTELSALDPRTIAANSAMLAARLGSAEAAARTAQQQIGGMARELEFKEQGSAALEAEQRLKRLRAELVELSSSGSCTSWPVNCSRKPSIKLPANMNHS